MSFTKDGVVYRNLEEQVLYNKQRLDELIESGYVIAELGIKVVGKVATAADLPTPAEYKEAHPDWKYGDAYLVGTVTPYNLYVLTRGATTALDAFFNLGQFPAPGPKGDKGDTGDTGPQGPTGAKGNTGPQGTAGVGIGTIISLEPYQQEDMTVTPVQYWKTDGTIVTQNVFARNGEDGEQGPQGIQGPAGTSFRVLAHLSSSSQLPTPSYELQQTGAAYTINENEEHEVTEDKHLWIIQCAGQGEPAIWVDFGKAGIQGPQGPAGAQGPQGPTGPQGATGETGAQGPTGPQGPQGDPGPTYSAGTGIGISNNTISVDTDTISTVDYVDQSVTGLAA